MQPKNEDYRKYLIAGLGLTLALMLGLGVYSLNEGARLAHAAEAFTEERVARGAQIYAGQCTACHGANGEGGVGPALNNKSVLKNTLDSVFFAVIRSGVPGTQMPAWSVDFGGPLTDEDVRDLVALMRSWEPTAPEVVPAAFVPDAQRGAVLFSGTCSVCHGEGGAGTDTAPTLNDPARLADFPDDWYRGVIRNGRPAKGMPTWGTVLSPEQVEDLVALIAAWRDGKQVAPSFSVADLLDRATFSLANNDGESARLHVERALAVATGAGADALRDALAQLDQGDSAAALESLRDLSANWPLGDPAAGALDYTANCSACHGIQGEGGVGLALHPSSFVKGQTNAALLAFLQEGRPGTAMAGFTDKLDEAQLANIIAFLRLWQE
jgi:mono/diheme cytochrome c family protein